MVTSEEEAFLFSLQYASPWFFSAHSLEELELVPVVLTRVFRQA